MVQFDHTEGRRQIVHHGGTVTLVTRSWWIGIGSSGGGAGLSYTGPRRIEAGGRSYPVVDHLLIARLVALVMTLGMALLTRQRGRA